MMKFIRLISFFLALVVTVACTHSHEEKVVIDNESLLMATLYQQQAAEYTALCYQTYNLATLRLHQILEDKKSEKPLAIVVDVDETVLDNSPFEAKSILENSDYPTYWKEWCELANARAIPGALEFLSLAAKQGVETFYVTNRKVEFQQVSMKNMEDKGFPNVDDAHMLFRTDESNKENRRQKVLETHEIVLLIGDNLNDFTELFEANTESERAKNVEKLKAEFGKKFIVLPNAMYGAWVDAIIGDQGLSKAEKLQRLREALVTF